MLTKITTAGLSTFAIMIAGGCGGFLMSSQEYLCKDTKGTLDDYKLYIHRSYFEKSKLLAIIPCYQDNEITLKQKTHKLEYRAYPEAIIKIFRYR